MYKKDETPAVGSYSAPDPWDLSSERVTKLKRLRESFDPDKKVARRNEEEPPKNFLLMNN